MQPLDNPVLGSLTGPHAHLAERCGQALRYRTDVAPFLALPDAVDAAVWNDVAELVGPAAVAVIVGPSSPPPSGWEVRMDVPVVRMSGEAVIGKENDDTIALTASDVPEMLDLVARTEPGPFLPRTIEMGRYLGIRRNGALIAMAGERLHPPGWTEVSAVCTDAAYRGQGLASTLVLAVVAGIRARGENPFLHASERNTTAIRLYESLGFTVRRTTTIVALSAPADSGR
jgi:GNAT superfamily N-acetyltransferase